LGRRHSQHIPAFSYIKNPFTDNMSRYSIVMLKHNAQQRKS